MSTKMASTIRLLTFSDHLRCYNANKSKVNFNNDWSRCSILYTQTKKFILAFLFRMYRMSGKVFSDDHFIPRPKWSVHAV